ncbi:MAG TPA: hypothetical protein DCS43_10720 [Verrucomicrobia bacterium]|nr:hypothetical protein [Verrucomicrobiota bacterium]
MAPYSSQRQRSVRLGARMKPPSPTARPRWYPVGAVIFLLLVLVGVGLVTWSGIRYLNQELFVQNDRFSIQAIEVTAGRVKTEPLILEYLAHVGITAGSNLFGFDIDQLVKLYLERNPLVKQMKVQRKLPGTLVVEIRERDPLARMGQRGALVADREGFVFRLNRDLHSLPVIIGDKDPELMPGRTVQGMSKAAIDVLVACDNPRMGLRLVGVDVSRDDYLRIHLLTSDGIKETKLSWDGMGRSTENAKANLMQRLSEVRQVAQQDRGGHTEYDATIPGRVYVR